MRHYLLWALAGLVVIAVLAAGVWLVLPTLDIPDDPDGMTLFSIDGKRMTFGDGPGQIRKGEVLMHGRPLLGQAEIPDPARRREVVAAVKSAVRSTAQFGFRDPVKCFWPRHVLRVVKDGKQTDVVICFECGNYELYRDGVQNVAGAQSAIGRSAEPLLNQILTDAGVPIAPPTF